MIESYPMEGVFTGYDDDGFPQSDRDYNAADLARYMSGIMVNGIIEKDVDPMMVTAAGSMDIKINDGGIHINGRTAHITDGEFLTIEPSDSLPRIDLISMRLDLSPEVRAITPIIIKGVPSASPVMPSLTRNSVIYDMILAKVYVSGGTYSIIQSNITDTRPDSNLCGMAVIIRPQLPDLSVSGTYIGAQPDASGITNATVTPTRFINLGFTPKWVIIVSSENQNIWAPITYYIYQPIIFTNLSATVGGSNNERFNNIPWNEQPTGLYNQTWTVCSVVENGFNVRNAKPMASYYANFDKSGVTYSYIAGR